MGLALMRVEKQGVCEIASSLRLQAQALSIALKVLAQYCSSSRCISRRIEDRHLMHICDDNAEKMQFPTAMSYMNSI